MKTYIKKIIVFCTISLLITSCDSNDELTTLEQVSFSTPVQASPSTVVIVNENLTDEVTVISWDDVVFPVDAPVTYALQFDLEFNTEGSNAWQNAIRVEVGEDVLSKSFSGNDLNDIATDLGLLPEQVGEIVVRVEANLDRKVYSDPITLTITPFESQIDFPQIYMVGGFQGWDFSNAATLPAISPGVYQGYISFPTTASLEFKFTTALNWDQFYGANPEGNFAEGGDTNLSVPNYTSYQITVNLNTLSYTAVPYSWGIIGTATPGGWDSDTNMTYDYQMGVWKYVGPLVSGAVKFRLNDAWTINYGPSGSPSGDTLSGVVLLDAPGAHTINTAANYEITYTHDPANPATANYTVIQQ